MRYIELLGLVDDTFAKYRKEECTPDSEWKPYCLYQGLGKTYEGYTVYCGAVKDELKNLIDFYQEDQQIKFTDTQIDELFSIFETANSQDNDDDAWTDIMFRVKFYFIEKLVEILKNYDIAG